MVIHKATLQTFDEHPRQLRLETNCYWVTVWEGDVKVFERRADSGPWLDSKHWAVAKALKALEKAVIEALEP